MIKSISGRLIITYSLIICTGLILFSVVVIASLSRYSVETIQTNMEYIAQNVAGGLDTYVFFSDIDEQSSAEDNFSKIINSYGTQIQKNFLDCGAINESYEYINVYIITKDGKLMLSDFSVPGAEPEPIGTKTLTKLADCANSTQTTFTELEGISEKKSRVYVCKYSIFSNDIGYIVVLASQTVINSLSSRMTSIIVAIFLWFFLGCLIAVFVISTRITKPLKEITDAAKNYSDGDYTTKIKVDGNDEISRLSETFNTLSSSLTAARKQQDDFLASVAHDLRTPMTTISGFADGILDGTIPNEDQEKYLRIISEETKRLARLVTVLLNTTRVETTKTVEKAVFNLTEKTFQALLSFETAADNKKLDVHVPDEEPVYINADPDGVHQVLYNLLHNAVKFSPVGGKLDIAITKKDGKAYVSIKNEGDGIPKEEQPYIFDRFYKSDRSRGLDKVGVGMGLFIVKTVISRHGETIEVKSDTGKGCEFIFSMPLAKAPTTK